jgi:hypothetical protein
MSSHDDTLSKLERRRLLARMRAVKFYLAHKDKVLKKQKEARQVFNEKVKAAYIEKGIPLIRQPPPSAPRWFEPPVVPQQQWFEPPQAAEPDTVLEQVPEQQPSRARRSATITNQVPTHIINTKTKEVIPILTFDVLKNNIKNIVDRKTGKNIAEMTQNRYINDAKILFRIFNTDKLNNILKNPTKVIKTIEEAKQIKSGSENEPYSVNSKKGLAQLILQIIDNGLLGEKLKKDSHKEYLDYYKRYDFMSKEKTKEPKQYRDMNNYVAAIKSHFGEDSKEYIIARLYQESTRRDDFKLKIVGHISECKDPNENYLVVPKTRAVCETVINAHKTSSHFEPLTKKLSLELSDIIKKYMEAHNIGYGNYLFALSTLSRFISKMSAEVGYPNTAVNTLRHMAISTFYASNPSLEAKQQLSNEMGHGLVTAAQYAGSLIP